MKRDSAITSMNQALPDDFVHVKRFSNLDTRHQCSASAAQSEDEADMSDESRPASPSLSVRSRKEDEGSRGVNELDSIIYEESMDRMLEETPNEIIFNHNGYSNKAHKKRVSSSIRQNEANDFLEDAQDRSFED
mmetsp:Transcript_20075/g.30850  ORF Transcript_20075/g.30850 Transcript_20075/m.30850 type:complete len:134 (+) Transcript_20075:772-1173(+)